nr:hypothetical protein 7 [bacterium]
MNNISGKFGIGRKWEQLPLYEQKFFQRWHGVQSLNHTKMIYDWFRRAILDEWNSHSDYDTYCAVEHDHRDIVFKIDRSDVRYDERDNSANGWIIVSGTLTVFDADTTPKDEFEFDFMVKI